jgi:hypothetical protein
LFLLGLLLTGLARSRRVQGARPPPNRCQEPARRSCRRSISRRADRTGCLGGAAAL